MPLAVLKQYHRYFGCYKKWLASSRGALTIFIFLAKYVCQPLVKIASVIYNRHVGFDGAVPCEQLEEMVLFSIGFQLPPTCKAQNLYSYTFWRSRLVWSRARDWKSRNRQKRFKSSNLFFSANQNLNRIRKCLIWVFLLQKFRFYWCFSVVSVPSFQPFRGS